MKPKPILMVLGIRPDVIRASIMLRELRNHLGSNFKLVWSGQHYSDNLKDVFFRELEILPPEIELNISGDTDADLVSSMISELSKVLVVESPQAVIFLGDTNTVTGAIAAAQLNIPIIHIEGCMRSYDWRMPEEKYRTIADHLSDYIYAYLPEYKKQGTAEGIPAENIIVTGNPIVDVIQEYFLSGKLRMDKSDLQKLLIEKYKVIDSKFLVMTCHRRENVENKIALQRIFDLVSSAEVPVLFPAGYRTQKMIKQFNLKLPSNLILVDPIGYLELLELLNASIGVLTDSGTIVEEASVLGVPSIQMRTATERPQVYTCGASIKFDPFEEKSTTDFIERLLVLSGKDWKQPFGDGKASYRIVDDLIERFNSQRFHGHNPRKYQPYSLESFKSEKDN
jgi:UDP-N-acetylglucosamine 2-epimerase (non-hydrolysing)